MPTIISTITQKKKEIWSKESNSRHQRKEDPELELWFAGIGVILVIVDL